MEIDQGLELLQVVLDNQNNKEFPYFYQNSSPIFDAILIKPLKKRHIVSENIKDKFTRDTDLRFEAEEKYILPYVENFRYENSQDNKGHFKKWYLTKIPVRFSVENCGYLFDQLPSQFKDTRDFHFTYENYREGDYVEVHLSKEKREGERISMGYKDLDDKSFYEFRKLLLENDYLIICKHYQESNFLFLGAKEDDFYGTNLNLKKSLLFLEEKNKTKHFTSFSVENAKEIQSTPEVPHHNQWIISGAPGTGKSHFLKTESEKYFKEENIHRITFHPNYTNGNFVGSLKPSQTEGDTPYNYQIGVFSKVLIKALENPKENFVLIIEELNRGNTNEIFGDFFQSIERDGNGDSVYQIEPPEDLSVYLKIYHPDLPEKLILPKNFYIWSTLNHSEQHTFPIDTAFIRRWKNHYIGIDEMEQKIVKHQIKLPGRIELVPWNDIRKKINNELYKNPYIREDQLLGPFFISKQLLTEEEFFYDVILYLKENVVKDNPGSLFTYNHTSLLKNKYIEGNEIFRFSL